MSQGRGWVPVSHRGRADPGMMIRVLKGSVLFKTEHGNDVFEQVTPYLAAELPGTWGAEP